MFFKFAGFSLRADYGKAGTTARTEAREILGNPCVIGAVPVLQHEAGGPLASAKSRIDRERWQHRRWSWRARI